MTPSERAIERGLRFLARQQQADGSFLSYSSPQVTPFSAQVIYRSPFPTSLILSCLTYVSGTELLRKKAAAYLLKEQGEMGSWNYWSRRSREFKSQPYPDDLDDTFCALTALVRHDPALLTGELLTKVARLLVQAESTVGGPYYTWLVGEGSSDHWKDVDVAVNANVTRFLQLTGAKVPPLLRFIERRIKGSLLDSRYYPSQHMVSWFLAHSVTGEPATLLQKRLARSLSAEKSPLRVALLLSSLLMLGYPSEKLKKARDLLLHSQKGGWPAEAFCLDPARDGVSWYAGSKALTTAICLQALAQFQEYEQRGYQETMRGKVRVRVEKELGVLAKPAQPLLEKVMVIDTRLPILTFPVVVMQALGEKVDEAVLQQLGTAGTLGWMAYTFLDDLIDLDELPNRELVPVTAASLTGMAWLFESALPDQKFQKVVQKVVRSINEANSWELANCRIPRPKRHLTINRLPEYRNNQVLADRTLGHALAGVGVLLAAGKPRAVGPFLKFCTHLLIARQLSDDALDWEADLRAGHINAVAATLIRPSDLKRKHPLEPFVVRLQKRFKAEQVKDEIKRQIALGRTALAAEPAFKHPEKLTRLADGLLKRG